LLHLYSVNHSKINGLVKYKELRLEREINQLDTLSFLYPISDPIHISILEECYIRTKDNEYVVKEVNFSDENFDEYICKVNIEDISGKDVSHFEIVGQDCSQSVNLALAGTGWIIGSCDVTKKRTVRKNNCTAYDILQEIQSAYSCEMEFDAINKKVYIYQQMGTDKGAYFIDQLNLKSVNQQRDSYDYVTRLIPIGKDGLDITSVNCGKNYIENYQYSNKIITAFWEDNRYTVATDLFEDATERLDYVSKPLKSYSASVYDLAKISSQYSILDYNLGDTITLLNKVRGIREKQRIVKTAEYPDEPEKNTVEIANKIPSIDGLIVRFQDTSDTVDCVTSTDGSINGSKLDGVDWSKVNNVSINTADIQDASITIAKIGNAQITEALIADASISNAKIQSAAIDTANIKDAVITNAKISNGAISTVKIQDASVTNAKIANAAISSANIQDAAIGTAKIATGAITNALISNSAVGTTQIADGSITDAKIVSLTANKITAGTIDAAEIDVVNLNAANINVGTINGSQITDGAISAAKIENSAVDSSKIAVNAVGNDAISASSITGDKIVAEAVTAREIAANTITADKLLTGTITTSSACIDSIDASKITAGEMSFNRAKGGTLKLGDTDNQNGKLELYDINGELAGEIDGDKADLGQLFVGEITAQNLFVTNDYERTIYVNSTTGDDSAGDGSSSAPYATIGKAISKINKYLTATVSIDCTGTFNEIIKISGFIGEGALALDLNTSTINGQILLFSNTAQISIKGNGTDANFGIIKSTVSNGYPVMMYRCSYVFMQYVLCNGNNLCPYAIYISGSRADIRDSAFCNGTVSGIGTQTAQVSTINIKGSNTQYGLTLSCASFVGCSGTVPCKNGAATTWLSCDTSSECRYGTVTGTLYSVGTGGSGISTYTYYAAATKSWRSSGWRSDNNRVYQGEYSSYGNHKGCIFFGSANTAQMRSDLSGKTIDSVALYIKRYSGGGSSSDQYVNFYMHNYDTQPAGEPTLGSNMGNLIKLSWGEAGAVNLPTSFGDALKSGSARGVLIYQSSGSPYLILEDLSTYSIRLEIRAH
jgi:phage minor structural protein